jgi:TctA family transporter
VPIAIGLFGIAELAVTLGVTQDRSLLSFKFRDLWPSWAEIRQCIPAMLRGTAIGSVLGVLPGGGAALSSFAAYGVEKKSARYPERFGRGAIEGVAAPGSCQQRRCADRFHTAAHAWYPWQRHHGIDGWRDDDSVSSPARR